jgi:hypothetical protein
MTDKKPTDLIEAHEAMAAVLDAKLPNVKEWTAFRAIDRALLGWLEEHHSPAAPAARVPRPAAMQRPRRMRRGKKKKNAPTPYMALADQVMTMVNRPVSTGELMDYIGTRRTIDDAKKVRNVVQSSLSKDERFESIEWRGGRAWWYADKPVPTAAH